MAQQARGSSPLHSPTEVAAIAGAARDSASGAGASAVPVPAAYRAVLYSSFHDCIKCLSEFACSGAMAAAAPPSASSGVLHGGHGLQQDVAMEAIRHMRLCASFIAKYPQVRTLFAYTVFLHCARNHTHKSTSMSP